MATMTKTVLRDKYRFMSVIAAIGVAVISFTQLFQMFYNTTFKTWNWDSFFFPGGLGGLYTMKTLASLFFAVALLVGKKGRLLVAASAVYCAGGAGLMYCVFPRSATELINTLINVLVYASLFIVIFSCCIQMKQIKRVSARFFWIPAAFFLIYIALNINALLKLLRYRGIVDSGIVVLVQLVTIFFIAKWVTAEYETVTVTVTDDELDGGYIDMLTHILLLLFTFGIWFCIWIYRTTDFLNKCKRDIPRSPVSQLLLCMFVPFYIIYWIYKSAQRTDTLGKEKGRTDDISTLCLVLEFFISIVPPILIQNKINSMARQPQKSGAVENPQSTDAAEEILKFKQLLDSGAITEEEYKEKKKQLMGL